MREILFKAKRIDNVEWIEGYYQKRYDLLGNEEHLIFHADSYKVWEYAEIVPETICQFTGLFDKNGNKIWENDIVNHNGKYASVKFGMYCSSFDYGSYNFGFYVDFPEETFYRKELGYWCRKVEVAGDIFDNPELLQEESDE